MQPTHTTAGERSSKLSGINVLVVEDYPDTLYLFQLILQRYGAHVTPARDGFEALRIMQSEPIDVLISDIGLPEMNGYELLRRIRADERLRGKSDREILHVPAAAVSAFFQPADLSRSKAAGFQAHLPKPVDIEELVDVVATLAGVKSH
jgi:CheY-like chemotaxis protein